jgi:vancomycin resistance protein VanW
MNPRAKVPRVRWRQARRTFLWVRDLLLGRRAHLVDGGRPRVPEPPPGWHCIGACTTVIRNRPELGEENAHRVHNMRLATAMIHGVQPRAREILSLSRLVGEPSGERGFRAGPVVFRGGLASASGGGLCQIATTLYGAALQADLEILEKHGHSSDLWGERRLAPLGADAVYVHLRKDLVLRNRGPSPVVLHLEVDEGATAVTCRVWSPAPLAYEVRVAHEVRERIPSSLPSGRPGWLVCTTRSLLAGGRSTVNYRRLDRYAPEGTQRRHRPRDP